MNRNTAFGYINYYYNVMKQPNALPLTNEAQNVIYEYYLKYGTRAHRSPSRNNFIYEMMSGECGARSVIPGKTYFELFEKIGPMYP